MMTRKVRRLSVAAAVVASLALASLGANADSTLHIGPGAGTSCATGCAGDPNLLGGAATVDVYQNSGGASALSQPVLLILGVPNDTTNLFTTDPITGVTSINPYPGGATATGSSAFATGGTYGLTSPLLDGFFGSLGAGQEVYSFLNLSGANNSNSFTNWSAADASLAGITAGNFGVYVFAVDGTLGPQGLLNLGLSSSVPVGSFIVAYGESTGRKTKIFDTPFTEAGFKNASSTPTPEPMSLFLFGSGVLAIGTALRRRLSR